MNKPLEIKADIAFTPRLAAVARMQPTQGWPLHLFAQSCARGDVVRVQGIAPALAVLFREWRLGPEGEQIRVVLDLAASEDEPPELSVVHGAP